MSQLPVDFTLAVDPGMYIPGHKSLVPSRINQDILSRPIRWMIFPEKRVGVPGARSLPTWNAQDSTATITVKTAIGDRFHVANQGMNFSLHSDELKFNADTAVAASESFTWLVHVIPQDPGSANYVISAATSFAILTKHASTSGQWGAYFGGAFYSSGTAISPGSEYVFIFRRNGSSLSFFKNGIKEPGSGSDSSAAGGNLVALNAYQPNGSNGCQGDFLSSIFVDGALSDQECIELTKNPYLITLPAG